MKNALETLQPIGRALMLPIAVLPVAGLLLRLGQPDMLDVPFVAAAGTAIFQHLGLLFAIGVAIGLAKENHGAAGLAGVVCFLVATTGAQALVQIPPEELAGFTGAARALKIAAYQQGALQQLGVPVGIASGLIAGWLYNRFHNIKLPDYLAFFGGRRFVPIAAGCAALPIAALLGWGWPHIEEGMTVATHAVLGAGAFGLFIYGVLNRLLIVTGLHHIINNIAWFILGNYHGSTGDLNRFFAGDPSAGVFMSGFFPVMMFGLPAACLAMYHTAKPERRAAIGGLLFSMALTSFLTGVTEPIEFSFMFLAPPLYAIHAILTGFAMVLMSAIGVHLGFSFSAGLFDYVINFGKSTHPWLLWPVGAAYFALYYGIFRFAIQKFDLKTPGREDEAVAALSVQDAEGRGRAFADALGGAANLESVDACTTRLRLIVKNMAAIDEPRLRALGARGFVKPSDHALQVVLGPIADQVAGEIRAALMVRAPAPAVLRAAPEPVRKIVSTVPAPSDMRALLKGLGGATNVKSIATCSSRLRVAVRSTALVDVSALRAAGVRGTAKLKESVHVVIGPAAEEVAEKLKAELAAA